MKEYVVVRMKIAEEHPNVGLIARWTITASSIR